MPLPDLTIGLVVRYEYLWARRAEDDANSADKDHPACVVATFAGLDAEPQWVLISECNIDVWPYDLRQIPTEPGRFHYGHLPPRFFKSVRDRFVALYRSKNVKQVSRTPP